MQYQTFPDWGLVMKASVHIVALSLISVFYACTDSKQAADAPVSSTEQAAQDTDSPKPSNDLDSASEFELLLVDTIIACRNEIKLLNIDKVYTGFNGNSNSFSIPIVSHRSCDTASKIKTDGTLSKLDKDQSFRMVSALDELLLLKENFEVSLSNQGIVSHDQAASSAQSFINVAIFDTTAPGQTILTVKNQGLEKKSTIVVNDYTNIDVAAGASTYQSQNCAQCHGTQDGKVDHSPSKIGQCSDEEIIGAVNTGTYASGPGGQPGACTGYELKVDGNHAFGFDAETATQIVAYLRSLEIPSIN